MKSTIEEVVQVHQVGTEHSPRGKLIVEEVGLPWRLAHHVAPPLTLPRCCTVLSSPPSAKLEFDTEKLIDALMTNGIDGDE